MAGSPSLEAPKEVSRKIIAREAPLPSDIRFTADCQWFCFAIDLDIKAVTLSLVGVPIGLWILSRIL